VRSRRRFIIMLGPVSVVIAPSSSTYPALDRVHVSQLAHFFPNEKKKT
jgi:hypothetical protein